MRKETKSKIYKTTVLPIMINALERREGKKKQKKTDKCWKQMR